MDNLLDVVANVRPFWSILSRQESNEEMLFIVNAFAEDVENESGQNCVR